MTHTRDVGRQEGSTIPHSTLVLACMARLNPVTPKMDTLMGRQSETLGCCGNRIDPLGFMAGQHILPARHCCSPDPLNCALMKRLVSHRPQAIDLWLSATAASAAIAVITLCAQLP
jgi:hypothetical protein